MDHRGMAGMRSLVRRMRINLLQLEDHIENLADSLTSLEVGIMEDEMQRALRDVKSVRLRFPVPGDGKRPV